MRQSMWSWLACASLLAASEARAEWGTYQGDAAHDGYVPGVVDSSSPHPLLWSISGLKSPTGVAVGGGDVYVSSNNPLGPANSPALFAFNANTGAIAWAAALGSNFSTNTPAYANGAVFVQTDNETTGSYLWSMNAATGAQQFKTPFAAQWEHYLAPTVINGNVYTDGGAYGGMYSFNTSTGTQNWFGTVPQYDGWTPSIAGNFAFTFTGSGDTAPIKGVFSVLNRTTGATVSTTIDPNFVWTGYTMNQAPALGVDNDAFLTNGNRLLDFSTISAGGLVTKTDHFSGQVTVANGTVFVDDGPSLAALTEIDESTQWTWTPADNAALLGQIIATNNVLFTSTASDIYAIDESTGATLWSLPLSGALALSDDVLYVTNSSTGTISAIGVPEPLALTTTAIGLLAYGLMPRSRRTGVVHSL